MACELVERSGLASSYRRCCRYCAAWGKTAPSEPAPWAAEAIDWGQNYIREQHKTSVVQGQSLEAIENKGGLGSAGITGYGFDDRVLGAPITLDKTVLFTVQSPEATYLRGESKSIYNGHGWEQPEHQLEERLIGKGETSPAIASSDLISARSHGGIVNAASAPLDRSRAGSEGAGSKEITASLESTGSKEDIFAGIIGSLATTESSHTTESSTVIGQLSRSGTNAIYQTITAAYPTEGWPLLTAGPDAQVTAMQFADGTPGESYQFDKRTDAIYPASTKDRIAKYTVSTLQPDLSSIQVNSGGQGTAGSSGQDPADIMWNYTKLPEGLPARIGKLAGQITDQLGADADRYDKAEAIEAYLRTHYAYTLTDTSVLSWVRFC